MKILEAMALGRPIVSTSIGCEGLEVENGRHLLVTDAPDDFAGAVCRLLEEKTLRNYLAVNARELVVTHYDWDVLAARLCTVYTGLVDGLT